MGHFHYKGYNGTVEYSEADHCLFGSVVGLNKSCILYEGNTIDELKAAFEIAIDDYVESRKANGLEPEKPYTGSLNIRISPEIHSRIAMYAKDNGTSINAFIRKSIEKQLEYCD